MRQPATLHTAWQGSLHQTFRLLPEPSPHLRPFLESQGLTEDEVLLRLPYDAARSRGGGGRAPDRKRYRDPRQVYQTIGLVYEGEDDRLRLTQFGKATLRWLDLINEKNAVILGRHAAYALAACQLRNPTYAGSRYDPSVEVFPFAFIWRAMLALDGRISTDELNRAVFRVTKEDELGDAIQRIANARQGNDAALMGAEAITGPRKNDRIIPWMSLASFGWVLISDKRGGEHAGYYEIPAHMSRLLREASRVRHPHREFGSVPEYVERISRAAALPEDLR